MGMIALKCPSCGADIQLDDSREFGFCNYCGTKVMQDTIVVEHKGEVKIDKNEEIENLKIAASNAMKAGNYSLATKHYERLSILSPNSWETLFFPTICKFESVTNGELHSYATEITNVNATAIELISKYVDNKTEQIKALNDVVSYSYVVACALIKTSISFALQMNMTSLISPINAVPNLAKNSMGDTNRGHAIINILYSCGNNIESNFDMSDKDFSNIAVDAWKKTADLHKLYIDTKIKQTNGHIKGEKFELLEPEQKAALLMKTNQYEPTYTLPEIENIKKNKKDKEALEEFERNKTIKIISAVLFLATGIIAGFQFFLYHDDFSRVFVKIYHDGLYGTAFLAVQGVFSIIIALLLLFGKYKSSITTLITSYFTLFGFGIGTVFLGNSATSAQIIKMVFWFVLAIMLLFVRNKKTLKIPTIVVSCALLLYEIYILYSYSIMAFVPVVCYCIATVFAIIYYLSPDKETLPEKEK